jgi:hypothetical protein
MLRFQLLRSNDQNGTITPTEWPFWSWLRELWYYYRYTVEESLPEFREVQK